MTCLPRQLPSIGQEYAGGRLALKQHPVYKGPGHDLQVRAFSHPLSQVGHPGIHPHTIYNIPRIRPYSMLCTGIEVLDQVQAGRPGGIYKRTLRLADILKGKLANRQRPRAAMPVVLSVKGALHFFVIGKHFPE